ncbi:AraC family transcriptional regulator [Algoriphagus yeomjeoni]|uniref:AraC family transcriptional regulator n=1 Tax=Algoriphagus yeomjeoni TaxID=291403 RepID=A0A327P5J6_9BACT|nr:helix-turn-helix domain-containing protein [Algoriphagus yeomjeoni]RAI86973.1 AraC family transcriptional regulator [Algoriphagus yeomjeoni]
MPKSPLPIFHIPDFGPDAIDSSHFYYAGLKSHLATHQFIQKPHKHDFYIIVVFTHGSGSHTIDFKTYAVEPGSVFFLSPGQVHSWELTPATDGHIIFFSGEFYTSTFPRKRLNTYSVFNSIVDFPALKIGSEEAKEVLYLVEKIDQETKKPTWHTKELLKNYIDTLLIFFYRYKGSKTSFSKKEKLFHEQFQELELLIEDHFKKHREASFYADKMNLSLKQLNSLCKNTVSKTSSQLIMDRVILEAQRLLTHSDLNISDIAYALEFDDASYFSRLFKKKTNMTPEQFRKQLDASF